MTYESWLIRRWSPKALFCLAAALLWLSCGSAGVSDDGGDQNRPTPELPGDQAILFEVGYVNRAWGYQCSGWYINRDGQRYSYSYAETDEPWQPQDSEAITESELLDKYSHGAELLGVVDSAEVAAAKAIILESADGCMSDTTWPCADFGAVSYLAYVREDSSLTYRPVLLYLQGDMAFRNLSGQARILFTWLREVSGEHGEIACPASE